MGMPETVVPDLVPLRDRLRWMLTYRMAIVALVPFGGAVGAAPVPPFGRLFMLGAGWFLLSLFTLPAQHLGRRVAVSAFMASLLGDGLLLGALRTSFGWLGGPVEIMVVGHIVAVLLLASFRTGVKITLWHVLVCFLVLQARAVGLLGPAFDIDWRRFALLMSLLWLIMVATASFTAVNERELRRRRYDTDRLRTFGSAVAHRMAPAGVVAALAGFARDELLAHRAAVLLFPEPPASGPPSPAIGYVLDGDQVRMATNIDLPGRSSMVYRAVAGGRSVLAARVTEEHDELLASLLPGGHHLVVVPFRTDEASGALVIEHTRRSSQRASRRVELRMVDTAEQVTAQAALAIGRALLLEQAERVAHIDDLTGLANRRALDERLDAETRDAADDRPLTLVMIDLDHFTRLNDRHGHQVGDETLRTVARVLRDNTPLGSLAARYGGEELALILPQTDADTGYAIAERIRAAIEAQSDSASVTASFGVASAPVSGDTPAHLLDAADAALHQAKRDGRNRTCSAGPLAPPAEAEAA